MSHQDGRCASSAETVVVTSTSGNLPASVSSGIRLVVIRGTVTGNVSWTLASPQMTLVGQSSGTLKGTAASATVAVTGGDIYIRDLSVAEGANVGISVTDGTLRMNRCYVLDNVEIGIKTTNSAFDIVNTVVAGNGESNNAGVNLAAYTGTGPTRFAWSTVVDNGLIGVACGATYTLTGILANGNGGLEFSPNCVIDTTTSTAAPAFGSPPYHLSATSPCVNAGGSNCPPDDIDGDPRPQGAACDCGADEYEP
jgi:hypothetical protein